MNVNSYVVIATNSASSRVETHSHPDIGTLRPAVVLQQSLGVHHRGYCLRRSEEHSEERATFWIHDDSASVGDRIAHQSVVFRNTPCKRFLSKTYQQASRVLDICEQERDRPRR